MAKISAGYYGSYAIDENGHAKGWGLDGYLMGTDQLGRDVFRRLLVGGRMTMTVGFIAVIISTIIGVLVGGVSGYKGGKVDNLLMRLTEIVSSIPGWLTLPTALFLGLDAVFTVYVLRRDRTTDALLWYRGLTYRHGEDRT